MKLVQIKSAIGEKIGLFLVPKKVLLEELEDQILLSGNLNSFAENNSIGAVREFVDEIHLTDDKILRDEYPS